MISKSRLRGRSKSVSLDPRISSSTRSNVATVSRKLFGNRSTGSSGSNAAAGSSQLTASRRASVHTNAVASQSPLTNSRRASLNENMAIHSAGNSSDVQTENQSGIANVTINQNLDGLAESGLSSGEKLAYENRISRLVESNQKKINRIHELMADRKALSDQVDSLHRMNFALTATVDKYQAEIQDHLTQGIAYKFLYYYYIL